MSDRASRAVRRNAVLLAVAAGAVLAGLLASGCSMGAEADSAAGVQTSGITAPVSAGFGRQVKFSGCRVRGPLPDPACTPGAIFAGATAGQVCRPGYAESVRNVSPALKSEVYGEYGIYSHVRGSYEVDHLVSLELGGSNARANLWPESAPGYREKDGIEDRLHAAVCAHEITLAAAQREIARDWRHTYAGPPLVSR
jgi:hypothetical protein